MKPTTTTTERRSHWGGHELRLEERADGAKVLIGYAAVYYNSDDPDGTQFKLFSDLIERVRPGAFDEAIEEGADVRGLFNHEVDNLLGRTASETLELSSDDKGLRYAITLGDSQVARDVAAHVARRDLTGSSFSFRVVEETFTDVEDGPTIRELVRVELFDVGPVTFPAYSATEVGLRSVWNHPRGPHAGNAELHLADYRAAASALQARHLARRRRQVEVIAAAAGVEQ